MCLFAQSIYWIKNFPWLLCIIIIIHRFLVSFTKLMKRTKQMLRVNKRAIYSRHSQIKRVQCLDTLSNKISRSSSSSSISQCSSSSSSIAFFIFIYIYIYFFFLYFFHCLYFKFIYVNILVWFVVLVYVSDEGVMPKAHVFCFVLYLLQLHSICFRFFTVLHN